jgi:predicted ester cyclase
MLRAGFPDLRADIEQVVAQDDLVVLRMNWRGTQTGSVMGIPPTGKTVAWQVIDTMRVADGKVVEHWGVMDQFGLLSQLGAVPTPVAAS